MATELNEYAIDKYNLRYKDLLDDSKLASLNKIAELLDFKNQRIRKHFNKATLLFPYYDKHTLIRLNNVNYHSTKDILFTSVDMSINLFFETLSQVNIRRLNVVAEYKIYPNQQIISLENYELLSTQDMVETSHHDQIDYNSLDNITYTLKHQYGISTSKVIADCVSHAYFEEGSLSTDDMMANHILSHQKRKAFIYSTENASKQLLETHFRNMMKTLKMS